MSKSFSDLFNKNKPKNLSLSEKISDKKDNKKSSPMIIIGIVVSLSSIFLLLFTINNKFG